MPRVQPTTKKPYPLIPAALLALGALLSLVACDADVDREIGVHADGSPAYEREYIVTRDSLRVPHGAHATWHRTGTRRTLEFFKHGVREGYVFEWSESGALIRMEACVAGVCTARALPDRPIASAAVLAETRFR